MASLQRKVAVVGVARLASAGAAVVTNVALARLLSKETNGLAQQALIVVNVAVLLGQSGIQASCYTFLPRLTPEKRRTFFTQSLWLLGGLGLLALAGVLVVGRPLAHAWNSPELPVLLRALGGFVFFSIAASAAEAALLTENRQGMFLGATLFWAGLHAGGVLLLLLFHQPLPWVLSALSVAAAAKFFGFVILGWRALPGGAVATWDRALLFQQLGFIAPLAVHGAVDVFSRWLDRSLISTLFTPSELAVYTYGALEIPFVGVLIGAITPVLLPELSAAWGAGNRERILDLWGRATVRTAAFLFPLMLFLYPLAEAYLEVFYSGRYSESSPYLRAYLVLMPVRIIAFTPMLFALGRSGWVLAGAVIDLALNLAISLWLIPWLGMLGPAVGTVAATWVQATGYLFVIGAALGTPLPRLLPWKRLGRVAVEVGVVSVPLWVLARQSLPPLLIFCLAGVYCAGWAALRLRRIW